MCRARLAMCLMVAAGCSGNSAPPVTYYADIKPILDTKCVGCHQPDAIAPFSLLSFEDAQSHAEEIRFAVSTREMPPWLAGRGCNEYQGDRSLADDQIRRIVDWVQQGAHPGDPTQAVTPVNAPAPGLSRVDRTLTMPADYQPTQVPDDYRCFVLDWPETSTTFVTGFRVLPGNPSIVHHVIAYLGQAAQADAFQQLDDAEPGPGYTCFGGPGGPPGAGMQWIGAWAPGTIGGDFPTDTGIRLDPGSKIILQVHYNIASEAATPDRSSIQLKIDAQVGHQAVRLPFTNYAWALQRQMPIAADDPDVAYTYSADLSKVLSVISQGVLTSGAPFVLHSAGFHMHTHGMSGHLAIERASGASECLLDIPRWDFHWQGAYDLVTPTVLQPGDQMSITCHFNNSGDPVELNWGEGTADEMCLSGVYLTQ